MSSTLFSLPDDFGIGPADTLIHFYSTNRSTVKNKVVFTKNVFCLVQYGSKEVQISTGREEITNTDLFMLTSGSTLMSESVAENNRYEAILVFFGNDTLVDFCTRYHITITKNPSTRSAFTIRRDNFIDNYCQSLHLLRKELNTSIDELKIHELLGYISTKHPETFEQMVSQALADKTVVKLKQVVEFNLNKGLTIEELAFVCDMSVSTFKRHFASLYQMSPQKYFIQVKMEQAKRFLSLHKRPSDIYPELGYENLSAFSHEFKKYVGVSPKQFQDKNERIAKEVERLE